jgi:hypothetical protein
VASPACASEAALLHRRMSSASFNFSSVGASNGERRSGRGGCTERKEEKLDWGRETHLEAGRGWRDTKNGSKEVGLNSVDCRSGIVGGGTSSYRLCSGTNARSDQEHHGVGAG